MSYINIEIEKNIFKYLITLLISIMLFFLLSGVIYSDNISPEQSDPETTHSGSGGRINGLAISANSEVAFAASEFGGLFKSYDKGLSWTHVDSHVPVATWDVEVSPVDPNKIYATSFYDGKTNPLSGISVSADGGETWINPPGSRPTSDFCPTMREIIEYTNSDGEYIVNTYTWGEENFAAMGISINPNNPDEVYVGTWCGLAITEDAGETWQYVDPAAEYVASVNRWAVPFRGLLANLTQPAPIWDVVVHDNGIVDVCGVEGHYRKKPGLGWNTTLQPNLGLPGGRCSITVSPHEKNVLFATAGTKLYTSLDGGMIWKQMTNMPEDNKQGRIPFVETNEISQDTYDLWYGDVQLFSRFCKTPVGSDPDYDFMKTKFRCSDAWGTAEEYLSGEKVADWVNQQEGAHWDVGAILFEPSSSIGACPLLFSNDGGVYYNATPPLLDCHNPTWKEPTITPNALWIMAMSGFKNPGDSQNIYMGNQDTGTFTTSNAESEYPDWTDPFGADVFDVLGDDQKNISVTGVWNSNRKFRLEFTIPGTKDPLVLPSTLGSDSVIAAAEWDAGHLRESNYPTTAEIVTFKPAPALAQFGINSYAMLTDNRQLYITQDITAEEVSWTNLGAPGSDRTCGVKVTKKEIDIEFNELVNMSVNPKMYAYSFFVQSGPHYSTRCWGSGMDKIWRYDGLDSSGLWTEIYPPGDEVLSNGLIKAKEGYGGFTLYDVDPNNPERIIASHAMPVSVKGQVIKDIFNVYEFVRGEYDFSHFDNRMVISEDGGDTWRMLENLDNMMTGNGKFKYFTGPGGVLKYSALRPGYFQPSLLAFDPYDENIILAGGADSGVFLSNNSGKDWSLLTDPYTPSEQNPHIPRPRFALFDHDPIDSPEGSVDFYIGTQGRGVWKLSPLPDLSIKFAVTKMASQGEDITKKLKLVIANEGSASTADIDISLYLSMDDSVSERDLLLETISLKTLSNMKPIDPNEEHNYSKLLRNVKIPSRVKPGDYYVCAVVDRLDVVPEYREENNTKCSPIEITSSKSRR